MVPGRGGTGREIPTRGGIGRGVACDVGVAVALDVDAAVALDVGVADALDVGVAVVLLVALLDGAVATDAMGAGLASMGIGKTMPGGGIFSELSAPAPLLAGGLSQPVEDAPTAASTPIDRPSAGLTIERRTRDVAVVFGMSASYADT